MQTVVQKLSFCLKGFDDRFGTVGLTGLATRRDDLKLFFLVVVKGLFTRCG
jgi:hypothetical protein